MGLLTLVQMRPRTDLVVPVSWLLLPLASYLLLAALRCLSRDFAKHSRLEEPVLEDVDRTMKGAGSQGVSVRSTPVGSHDVLGAAVAIASAIELLSVFLLGPAGGLVLIYLTV